MMNRLRSASKRIFSIPMICVHLSLAVTYGLLDREAEAREAAAEVLRIDPDFSIEYFAKTSPIKDPADRKRLISALRKAGLM